MMAGLTSKYLDHWKLIPDGKPIITSSSDLLPVLLDDGTSAFLKVARCDEESLGNKLMTWWDGEGAVRVLAHDKDAVLLERAAASESLIQMARNGFDSAASSIICEVAAKLHSQRSKPLPELVPLRRWFAELAPMAKNSGSVLSKSLSVSLLLLDDPRDVVVLHGDLHHGNVLDGRPRGWLAIDPKALLGERGFDFANIFCNPDMETATIPGRLAEQAAVVAQKAGLDRVRLLQWILSYAGLSASWSLGVKDSDPQCALAVAEIAARELDGFCIRP